jgi:hypothetical protein
MKSAMAGSNKKPVRSLWDRLLTGRTPSDPLYLSNRTWRQKLPLALLVCTPVLAAAAAAAYFMLTPPTPAHKPPASLTPAEIAARTPLIPDNLTVVQNTDLQVVEAAVDRAAMQVYGSLKNNTARRYAAAELAFDLADPLGSQVGRAATRVTGIEPYGSHAFRFAIPHKRAAVVVVREVRPVY